MSLIIIAATSGSNLIRTILMMLLGLSLSTIGTDPLGGVFAIPEVAKVIMENTKARQLASVFGAI
ncbi:MAG: hypothetical protein ABJQ70_05815 [Roseobacter sp.]